MPVLARRAAVDAQGPRQARAGARSGRGGARTSTRADAEAAAAASTAAPRAHAVGEVCRFEGRAGRRAQVPREGTAENRGEADNSKEEEGTEAAGRDAL